MKLQGKVFVAGDHHFGDNAVWHLNRNNFESIEDSSNEIIKRHNKIVTDKDTIIFLGDIGRDAKFYIKKMNGYKILIMGNHDEEYLIKNNLTMDYFYTIGFDEVYDTPQYINDRLLLSHEPQPVDTHYIVNVHAHIHNGKLTLANYFNATLDLNVLKPLELALFEKRALQNKKVRKSFGKEWYFNDTEFENKK